LRAVLFRAVDFLAVLLRAVLFRAVDFLAVDLRAVDFLAVDLRAVDFLAVDLRAVDFLAVDFFAALDRFAVDFLAPLFLAVDFFVGELVAAAATRLTTRLAVLVTDVDDVFLAGDLRAELFVVLAVVVLRLELVAARVTFGFSSAVAGTCASCCQDVARWSTYLPRKRSHHDALVSSISR
jgi:hypothetical protein